MTNDYSITNNPIFQNCTQPFTELFSLLSKLQRTVVGSHTISYQTDTPTLQAIHQHADNAACTLIAGIQSLGALLAAAADNQEIGLPSSDAVYIGWLVQAVGNMLSGCFALKENLAEELVRRGIKDF